jgi:hypothetical protein
MGYLEKGRKERNVNVKEERQEWSPESLSTEVTEKMIVRRDDSEIHLRVRPNFLPEFTQYGMTWKHHQPRSYGL